MPSQPSAARLQPKTKLLMARLGYPTYKTRVYDNILASVTQNPAIFDSISVTENTEGYKRSIGAHMFLTAYKNADFLRFLLDKKPTIMLRTADAIDALYPDHKPARIYLNYLRARGIAIGAAKNRKIRLPDEFGELLGRGDAKAGGWVCEFIAHASQLMLDRLQSRKKGLIIRRLSWPKVHAEIMGTADALRERVDGLSGGVIAVELNELLDQFLHAETAEELVESVDRARALLRPSAVQVRDWVGKQFMRVHSQDD